MNVMKGYLTYTLAALTAIGAIAGYLSGQLDMGAAGTMLWGAVALFGIRRAI